MGRSIAYCRVSSRDQNPELQLNALTAHGYDQMFAEKEPGKRGGWQLHPQPLCPAGHR
jgi:DNA invertase Pin-like site-specific DNA recombinase